MKPNIKKTKSIHTQDLRKYFQVKPGTVRGAATNKNSLANGIMGLTNSKSGDLVDYNQDLGDQMDRGRL